MFIWIRAKRGEAVEGVKIFFAGLCAAFLMPSLAVAQAAQCAIPSDIAEVRAEFPPPGNARRVPVTGYVLALSWSPQFCKTHEGSDYDGQCKAARSFGFILHGLWPNGEGRTNPEYCRFVPSIPREVLRRSWCATPSAQLQQHEWAKHGSCMERDPARYFGTATRLFETLKWPDMNRLSQYALDVNGLTAAFVAANPELKPDNLSVTVTPLGWFEEIKLCLDAKLKPRRCPSAVGGAGGGTKLKIWRAAR